MERETLVQLGCVLLCLSGLSGMFILWNTAPLLIIGPLLILLIGLGIFFANDELRSILTTIGLIIVVVIQIPICLVQLALLLIAFVGFSHIYSSGLLEYVIWISICFLSLVPPSLGLLGAGLVFVAR